MSEPNGPWRLLYKNDSNVNTVLGVMGDVASSAYRLKQARWKSKARAFGKISFIAEKNVYKNIPQDSSEFGTTDSAIFWQGFRFNRTIQAVDTSTDKFTVSGDVTNDFEEGGAVEVNGSSRSDEGTIYKVQSPDDVTYDSTNDQTNITVVEDVTDSTVDGNLEGYENIFRGFAQNQGQITENGNVKFTLFSFLRRIAQENVTISSTDDIQDVMSKLTPSDYIFDSPASSNVTYVDSTGTTQTGYAPVDDYSLTDVDRAVGFREKIRNFGYVVKLKAHKELRFEPVGFGSSIDTIDSPAEGDTNNTRGNWIEWVAGDTNVANLVNTVRVVNSKGGKYDSGIITNSSSVQKHGKVTPKGGNPVKKGYVSSDDEAKRVAQNIIRDSQNPDEGGRVKVAGRYTNDVTNSTFTLNDSVRGINSETFVAWSQVNFYPENKTILEFEYENQSEKETNITDDVRAERSTVFSDQTTDVGGQTIDQDQSNTTTASADNSTSEDNQSPDTNGATGNPFGDNAYDFNQAVFDSASSTFTQVTVPTVNLGVEYYLIHFHIDLLDASAAQPEFNITIENTDTNNTLFNEDITFFSDPSGTYGTISFTAIEQESADGDTIEGELTEIGTFSFSGMFTLTVDAIANHDHITSGSTDAHAHNVDTTDLGHGDTADPSTHQLQGQTEVGQNINVSNEEKTDR